MIRAFILDDEERACNMLEILIRKYVPEITELKSCNSVSAALPALKQFKPSLLFLDIKMPHLSGFDFLNHLQQWDFDVIFTTAFDQYAINAIRFSALDYLLKPIDVTELRHAVRRHLLRRENVGKNRNALVHNLLQNAKSGEDSEHKLALTTNDGTYFLLTNEIMRCEADRNYTWFYLVNRKPMIVSRTLKEFDEILTPHGFIRSHKSHLVNKSFIIKLTSDGTLCLTDGTKVSVSRRRKEALLRSMILTGLQLPDG
ncbi:MAG TPA: LytTR family DNA-binding domain-containing protein [Ohtaekwangia sp.]|nr:LytTR family DNA-binding domain-containing protein [Ohtaekwangia sp.]